MNIKIIDGHVTVDNKYTVPATYALFTKEGINICVPKERQPDHRPCDKCRQWHDPDLCCHQPDHDATISKPFGRVATIGDVNHAIVRLIENLSQRCMLHSGLFDGVITLSNELDAEKDKWK